MSDPIEDIIATALTEAGIHFLCEDEHDGPPLDFLLTESGVFIECKQFHSQRIGAQMNKAANVIAIQGREAALMFARMIKQPNAKEPGHPFTGQPGQV